MIKKTSLKKLFKENLAWTTDAYGRKHGEKDMLLIDGKKAEQKGYESMSKKEFIKLRKYLKENNLRMAQLLFEDKACAFVAAEGEKITLYDTEKNVVKRNDIVIVPWKKLSPEERIRLGYALGNNKNISPYI